MTVMPRKDRWGVKVWDRGQRKYRWVGTFKTEAEALQAERDAHIKPGRDLPTVEQWSRIWLSDYARNAAATRRTYRYAIHAVTAELGHLKLDDVDRPLARRLANGWPKNTSRVARTMWAEAVRDGVCRTNPWTNLRLETPKGRKDLDALTEAEIARLADTAEAEQGVEMRAIVLVLAYTGVRTGELCALKRDDVNLRDAEITVRSSLDGMGNEKAPKNGKPRVIILPPLAAEAIRSVPARTDSPYLFHTPRGRRLKKANLAYLWRPVVVAWRATGGKDLDMHELRHACATLLLERGLTPADVAVQLGHTDGGRLVQVLYGHPSEDGARDRLKMAFAATANNVCRAEFRTA